MTRFDNEFEVYVLVHVLLCRTDARKNANVALAEWLRRVPAKYMGFPRESSNLSGDDFFLFVNFAIICFCSNNEIIQQLYSQKF